MRKVSREQARKLVGKSIYAVRKDGSVVTGKLLRLHGNKLVLSSRRSAKGKVQTKAFLLPLVLFDLLVIGTLPFWGGGYGYGGGYGGYGGGYGGGGFGGCGCGIPNCGCGKGGYPNDGYFYGY